VATCERTSRHEDFTPRTICVYGGERIPLCGGAQLTSRNGPLYEVNPRKKNNVEKKKDRNCSEVKEMIHM
jgi:hypothetical protein